MNEDIGKSLDRLFDIVQSRMGSIDSGQKKTEQSLSKIEGELKQLWKGVSDRDWETEI